CFSFDPFQADEAGANPFMILSAMEGRVFDVHLSDRREHDPGNRHLPPGEGDLPWPALLRAIAGTYSGPLMLEGVVGGDRRGPGAHRRDATLYRPDPARDSRREPRSLRRQATARLAGGYPPLQR